MVASVPGEDSCDVLVVGAGGAGFAAAIEAATAGAKVIMVEKNAQPGGTTALSVGSISVTQTPHQLRELFHGRDHRCFPFFLERSGVDRRDRALDSAPTDGRTGREVRAGDRLPVTRRS